MKAFVVCLGLLLAVPALAQDPAFEVHYSPVENLERIDLELINSAEVSIDIAAFVITDWAVIDAIEGAAVRGVAIRILLDPTQRTAYDRLVDLKDIVRVKRSKPIMHLKSYAIDGKVLRTGSANFSPSGLKQQDNDLIVIRDEKAAANFKARFDAVYAKAEPMRVAADQAN